MLDLASIKEACLFPRDRSRLTPWRPPPRRSRLRGRNRRCDWLCQLLSML